MLILASVGSDKLPKWYQRLDYLKFESLGSTTKLWKKLIWHQYLWDSVGIFNSPKPNPFQKFGTDLSENHSGCLSLRSEKTFDWKQTSIWALIIISSQTVITEHFGIAGGISNLKLFVVMALAVVVFSLFKKQTSFCPVLSCWRCSTSHVAFKTCKTELTKTKKKCWKVSSLSLRLIYSLKTQVNAI